MRAVITETRALGLAFCHWDDAWEIRASNSASNFTWDAGFRLCILVLQYCWDATFMLRILVIVVMLRRGFQPSRLGAALVAMISLASRVWILLFDDLSAVIFRQPTPVYQVICEHESESPATGPDLTIQNGPTMESSQAEEAEAARMSGCRKLPSRSCSKRKRRTHGVLGLPTKEGGED